MPDVTRLSPEMHVFIERMGLYYEQYGLARIGGRLLALLILADRPLSIEAMAEALGVARASISTNARLAVTYGFAERVSFPGNRRDYYAFSRDAWERGINVNIEGALGLRRLAGVGLAALAPDDQPARTRCRELRDFCDFYVAAERATLERWRTRARGEE